MRDFHRVAIAVALALGTACGEPGGGPSGSPAPAAANPAGTTRRMLPAWKTKTFRSPAAADPDATYRAQHPELYAITVPPSKAGFRAFVEWEPMQTILLSYTGFDSWYQAVGNSLLDMVRYGVDTVEFTMLVPDRATSSDFVQRLKSRGVAQATIDSKVHFLTYSADSIWMIDFGPFPLVEPSGTVAFSDFRYYPDRPSDDAVPTLLGNRWGVTTYRAPLYLEGGNFSTDGKGTCFASQVVFNDNPDKTQAEVEEVFRVHLGCRKLIVLIPEDDGTGHIDMFSKHVAPNVYVVGQSDDSRSSRQTWRDLDSNADLLKGEVLADGSRLTVHRIPMPYQNDGVWRTYTNSTFANGVNLFPVYADYPEYQDEATAVWKEAMPDWTHVGIVSDEIISWGGAMHCVSRAIPAGAFAAWVPDGSCSGGTCVAAAGGFVGDCTDSADCHGPEWLCPLNECGVIVKPCTPACDGRECGDDGCGSLCGQCPSGTACDGAGTCVGTIPEASGDVVQPDATGTDATDPDVRETAGPDAPAEVDEPAQEVPGEDDVAIGPDAGEPGSDPGTCTPYCPPGRCGADGCGGRCPECATGYFCNGSFHCEQAKPVQDAAADEGMLADPGPETGGGHGGGCVQGTALPASFVPAWLFLGIVALLAMRLVYTTARE